MGSTVLYCTVQVTAITQTPRVPANSNPRMDCCRVLSGPTDTGLGLYSTVLYCTVQYSTVQYNTAPYCTVSYSTVQSGLIDRGLGLDWTLLSVQCSSPVRTHPLEGLYCTVLQGPASCTVPVRHSTVQSCEDLMTGGLGL